jgi:GNAT superfamily N-acetyltransferase
VIEFRQATETERAAWLDEWRGRLQRWYDQPDVPAGWADRLVTGRIDRFRTAVVSTVFAITRDGSLVGLLAVSVDERDGNRAAIIGDVWITESQRRQGYATEALGYAEAWSRAQGASGVWVSTDPAEPAHAALFARYPVRAHQMIKDVRTVAALPDGVTARPMTEAEFADWRAATIRGYAADIADSGSMPASEAAASAAAQTDQLLPDGLHTANHSFLCLVAGGAVVATNWIAHHRMQGTSWVYGVEVLPDHRGRGYGRPAMIMGEQATHATGDTHLALNVFGHNSTAIRLYAGLRYRAYEDARSIEL